MYSSVPSSPWNPTTTPISSLVERASSAHPVSPSSPPPVSPSSPTSRGRLRGLSYLRSYTHNHILSRENHNHNPNSSTNNQNSRPGLSRNPSYSNSPSSPTSASAVASPATPTIENIPRQTLLTAQRSTNTPELISAGTTNPQENLGSTSGWLPTVGGHSGVSRIATQPQSTATASSSAVLSGNDPSAITSGLAASMARTRSAGTAGAADMPLLNTLGENSPASAGGSMSHQLPSIRFSPHQDPRAHRPSLIFGTMSRTLPTGKEVIKVGRYSERENQQPQATNVPSFAPVGFKSKVVSRRHCEFWCSGGRWYIKDVKSSSGTFLNHIRLSSPGTESRPYPVNDGDIVQLGIDFKGGEEMIFRCVKIRVELNKGWQTGPSSFNVQSHKRLRELNNNQKKPSVAGSSASNGSSQDCSICLGAIAPCQSLFVAPCSHTWHYKCIRVVINGPTWPHFICPNCRTVADLEAELDEPDGDWEELAASDEEVDAVPESAADFTTPHDTEPVAEAEEAAVPQAADPTAAPSLPEPETFEASDVHHTEDDLDTSDESSTGPPTHEAGIEGIAFLHVGDSPASSTSATPTPQANNNNSTVPPVDIITRKPVPSASTASSSRVEHIRGSPSPNGIHPVLADPLTGEGPMTPRNDVGPFIFDGGAGRTNGLRLASGVGNLEYNDTPTTAHATPHSAV
ncbi:hypothetical protein MFRU_003g02600 [Monilinia fructicola]|uniref:RING-type E3 ubiquitin transferase n=1 Tax=Monilinia fructicola TaxID=38448 RepID=A0A5M9K0X0_MONFR|nr:hypothetical protein EYC84_003152 [Monilinia fructicola]KAG4034290.1 hypothetical protein MFRU_003g02600 [Monilinia fructicola]